MSESPDSVKIRRQKYYQQHKEEILIRTRAYSKIYGEKNRKSITERARLRRQAERLNLFYANPKPKLRPASIMRKEKVRDRTLLKKYGIALTVYRQILAAQGQKCAICQTIFDSSAVHKANLDHCHRTGRIREILCTRCNLGLGCFKDNRELLTLALVYLRKHE